MSNRAYIRKFDSRPNMISAAFTFRKKKYGNCQDISYFQGRCLRYLVRKPNITRVQLYGEYYRFDLNTDITNITTFEAR